MIHMLITTQLLRNFFLLCLSILSTGFGIAQGDFEFSWTETREEVILVPPLSGEDTLSNLELTFVARRTPDTSRTTTGFSSEEGLFDEIYRLNPSPIEREAWQDPLPAYHRMDATGSLMKDAEGRILLREPPSERDREEHLELSALARSGALTPFVSGIIPSLSGRQSLSAQGYVVEVREPSLASRTEGDKFWGEQLYPLDPTVNEDRRVLHAERAHEKIVADARNRSITTYTYADSTNTVVTAVEIRFLQPAEGLGGNGFYETLIIEAREESLPTGRSVQRTTITRRADQAYKGPGSKAKEPSGENESFGSVANPLRAGQMLVAVPTAYRKDFRITLADVNGRLHVQSSFKELRTGLLPLELPSGLASGPYILSIHSSLGTLSQQVIIE